MLFLSYNQIQQAIRKLKGAPANKQLDLQELVMAGGISGAVVSFVLTPVELLKCQLQTQSYLKNSSSQHKSTMSLFLHTLRSRGIAGLYKGHSATMLRGEC